MENKLEKIKSGKLPTLAELYEDNLQIAFKQDQFNYLVNQEPKAEWIKENKYAGNSKYLPIGIVETLLQKIFKSYKIEVLREGVMFNAVYVTVRLHYLNLMNNEWTFNDGLGAVQLQTKQGTSPADLQNINNNAVMMALPMAKSYAIKDAAENIGKIFGRDINRKDVMAFSVDKSLSIQDKNDETEKQRAIDFINNATSQQQLKSMSNELLEKYDLLDIYDFKMQNLK